MELTPGYPLLQDPKLQHSSRSPHSILITARLHLVLKTSVYQGKDIMMMMMIMHKNIYAIINFFGFFLFSTLYIVF